MVLGPSTSTSELLAQSLLINNPEITMKQKTMGILNHVLSSGTVDSSLLQFFDSLRFDFATNYKAFSFIVLISGRRRNPQRDS